MTPANAAILALSFIIIIGSVVLTRIGYTRSALSLKKAAVLSGIGVGIGIDVFIFFVISNGDFSGSLCTAGIAGTVCGVTTYVYLGKFVHK